VIVLTVLYLPLLAYVWAVVVFEVRWARTGQRPPRLVNRVPRARPQAAQAAGIAGFFSASFAMNPGAPWHHTIGHRLAASAWEWWGTCIAAIVLPTVAAWFLTRSANSTSVENTDATV
jgi:hypothetical protein